MQLGPHTSSGYDAMLEQARDLLLQMAVRVERQLEDAMACLASGSDALIAQVMRHEAVINELERSLDALAGQIIARRHPAASDLRLLLSLVKATTDLERIGDEAKKIALRARSVSAARWPMRPPYTDIRRMAATAQELLRQAMRSLERLDPQGASEVVRRDSELDAAFRATLRQLVSYMIEDPRTISACLDVLFVAKSLERIGDHAKNLSEYVVYAIQGTDVRHATPEEVALAAAAVLPGRDGPTGTSAERPSVT